VGGEVVGGWGVRLLSVSKTLTFSSIKPLKKGEKHVL